MKRPQAINFSRKNDIHPFDSPASLEFFANKNDASLFVTGLHSKKRPHDLIFTRMFDGRVLDMLELGIEGIKEMSEFQVSRALPSTPPSPSAVPVISQRSRDAVHPSGECNSYAGRQLHAPPNEGHPLNYLLPRSLASLLGGN